MSFWCSALDARRSRAGAAALALFTLASLALADPGITVRVSGSDEVTTAPAYLQDVVITASSPAFVSGTAYDLGWAFATDDAVISLYSTISTVDTAITATDGTVTWSGPWGRWVDVTDEGFWELTFFPTRLFVVSAGDAILDPDAPLVASAVDATLAASPTIFPGRGHRVGSFDVSGEGYVGGRYVEGRDVTIRADGWGAPDGPEMHGLNFGALLIAAPDAGDPHRAFWNAFYGDGFQDLGVLLGLEAAVNDTDVVSDVDPIFYAPDAEGNEGNTTYATQEGFAFTYTVAVPDPLPADAALWTYYWHTTSDGDVWLASGSGVERVESATPSPAPTIVTPPADATTDEGGDATFDVTVSASGAVTYQWQTTPADGGAWRDVDGANAATWTRASVPRDADGTQVRVRVGNTDAGALTTVTASNAATLTVVPVTPAPTQVVGPADRAVVRGTPARFTVSATSPHPLAFAWERDDGDGWTPVPGADAATWTLSPTTLEDDGARVRAVVTAREADLAPAVVRTDAAHLTVHADDAPAAAGAWPAPGGAWLAGDLPATDDLVNVEVRLEGGDWVALAPPDVTPPFAVPDLPDGEPVRLRFRGVYAGGGRGAPSPWLDVTPGRPDAPSVAFRLPADADAAVATRDGEARRVTLDVVLTNEGSTALPDVWLDLTPLEAAGGATVVAVEAPEGSDRLRAYDGLWLWRDADLPPGASRTLTLTLALPPEAPR